MPDSPLHITVIIPTLDEEEHLLNTLESVCCQSPPFRIIVADGGSVDATRTLAEPVATVLQTPKGRGIQMHMATQVVDKTDVFLFLHADTVLPPTAFGDIRQVFDNPVFIAGCFRLRFDEGSLLMRFYGRCTHLRIRRMVFGDRAIFVRKSAYEHTRGFPNEPLLEDAILVRALRKLGRWAFLHTQVTTSARRFRKHGLLRQQIRNVALYAGFLCRLSPSFLARWYR
ncbi:MAG TPA: TIGR04283 family arsenosugar biosynthesis glycosyltransferase [Rhodothermales bacterium]|nr:glycosyl transferase [Bacteroidota bacterium]HRK72790.1 TIGR04283 family arsenosugar biosynthesis glycosyltransferase [Rhodothermales bacterium]HRR08087.1 TIGR04283 family arsenosugar biosynthesis glycosyltransferase [Rhodothermales bacterium]